MSSKGVALVTGAAQGIGRAVALRLASDGFDVAVNDISSNSSKLTILVEEIKNMGRASSKHVADVSHDDQVRDMVELVVKVHGGLDVMIANAGVGGHTLSLTEVSAEEWDRVININARGSFLCYKYAGIQMIRQGRGGRIIGASSMAGKQAFPTQGPYSASKFAVRGLTQSAAMEFGAGGITVNAYAPGVIDTPILTGPDGKGDPEPILKHFKEMSPIKQVGTPDDVASLVSFLASKEARFITGQSISINGGIFFD